MAAGLAEILEALAHALGTVGSFAVIGAVARNAWAPPRATTDVDVTIAASAAVLEAAERALVAAGYSCTRRNRVDPDDALPDLMIFRASKGALRQVDLLVAKTEFEQEALRRAVPLEIAGRRVPVATLEDLLIYKLIADRPRDREDVAVMLRTQRRAGTRVDWEYVERWGRFWEISDRVSALRSTDSDSPPTAR